MRITAHHAHLFPTQVRPAGDIAHLLSTLDACGIEQCVAFAPFGCMKKLPHMATGYLALV